jgi:hypothetical protein
MIKQAQKYTGNRNQQKRQGNKKNKMNFDSIAETVGVVTAVGVVAVVVVVSLPVDAVVGGGAAVAAIGGALSRAFWWQGRYLLE